MFATKVVSWRYIPTLLRDAHLNMLSYNEIKRTMGGYWELTITP